MLVCGRGWGWSEGEGVCGGLVKCCNCDKFFDVFGGQLTHAMENINQRLVWVLDKFLQDENSHNKFFVCNIYHCSIV